MKTAEEIVYVPTPISEKPEKEGVYFSIEQNGSLGKRIFNRRKWMGATPPASWLKPVPDSQFHSTEKVLEEIGKGWIASANWSGEQMTKESKHVHPDKETYLKTVKAQLEK